MALAIQHPGGLFDREPYRRVATEREKPVLFFVHRRNGETRCRCSPRIDLVSKYERCRLGGITRPPIGGAVAQLPRTTACRPNPTGRRPLADHATAHRCAIHRSSAIARDDCIPFACHRSSRNVDPREREQRRDCISFGDNERPCVRKPLLQRFIPLCLPPQPSDD